MTKFLAAAAVAGSLLLGGCATTSDGGPTDVIKQIQTIAVNACAFLPTAATIAELLSGGQFAGAAAIANAICAAVTQPSAPTLRRTGRPVVAGVIIRGAVRNAMTLDHITLQFSTTTDWQSGLIRLMTHSDFSHVDLVLPMGFPGLEALTPMPYGLLGASDPGGVMIRTSHYHAFKTRRRATLVTDKADAIVQAMATQIGKAFDDDALTNVVDPNRREWRQRDKWFCSELVTWALEESRFFPKPLVVTKGRITPGDLLLLLNPYLDPLEINQEVLE